jgi:diketogulonate reductase-like aldo/keto reductase
MKNFAATWFTVTVVASAFLILLLSPLVSSLALPQSITKRGRTSSCSGAVMMDEGSDVAPFDGQEHRSGTSAGRQAPQDGPAGADEDAMRDFAEVPAASRAASLTDAAPLAGGRPPPSSSQQAKVLMPWVGFGTYKLARDRVEGAVLEALRGGYRLVDTAFVYGGETTEAAVGRAIRAALRQGILARRASLFVVTKHWRSYHGYGPALRCLDLSLKRLQLDYVDLWLMHWPGPAWKTTAREQGEAAERDRWHYAAHPAGDMARVRAETWRAMEDAVRAGKCRAIGVSNFSIRHLKTLKGTATMWPPAVNQIEMHPLYPQTDLVRYCQDEGIVVQAYASLGGQDMGRAAWKRLLGGASFVKAPSRPGGRGASPASLLHAKPVAELARSLGGSVTPAQVLLRWGLERGCALVPKASSQQHLEENARVLTDPAIRLSDEQVARLQADLLELVASEHPDPSERERLTRLCWRNDPLRLLDFD